jgi:RNA polymerase sigma-70 factor (ECF subfamily)
MQQSNCTNDNSHITAITTEKGFRQLVHQYSKPLYWHIRRLVVSHADAEDVVQETFIKIFRAASDLRDESSLRAWVYRIATNEALRHLRRSLPPSCSLDEATSDVLSLHADEYIDYSDLESVRLQKAINTLPAKQRITFNLRYYDDLSYEEIAEITESTASNVKVNYHIAKNKVINFMNNHD